ncbi:MAG TPA: ribonucleotide-diphosphate reductase subunit beta [Candidatus Solibacter sp.]|jgi:ribonucleoside-diphosphate reductase beta chain|nr:ribonucleotide-diphosphate reductase subunit beta [Candidatus Solibacter sp.]
MSDSAATVVKVETTELDGLQDLDIEDVYTHIDVLLKELPGPLDLYQRWERQQWSAHSLDFSTDKVHWDAAGPFLQEQLEQILSGFFVGEQAVTDTLSPLLLAAPDEESRWFLSTQVVDEARHAYFFSRFFAEVLHPGDDLHQVIDRAWRWTRNDAYMSIFGEQGELTTTTEAVRIDPKNYGLWVEGMTTYHLMIEGILALVGQRLLLRLLKNLNLMPAFRAGFTAVTRDESRHVNYGIWALRRAVTDGEEEHIRAAVDRCLRPCLRIYVNPERLIEIPADLPPNARVDPRNNWNFAVDSVSKRLRAAGVEASYIEGVATRSWEIIAEALEEYERVHAQEHPVRMWERGELQAVG